MLRKAVVAGILFTGAVGYAQAGSIEDTLAKLAPEERAHQACIIKGLDQAKHDARLRGADQMKASVLSSAVLSGTTLMAKGGAIRAAGHWYALTFTCRLTADLKKATAFSFAVGAEIPKQAWDKYGLWG
jgi:hypothetical protein